MDLIKGNCLEVMKGIPDKSIDMILCDLPYGTTACKWDSIIPFEPLWEQYKRIVKSNGAICLFSAQPFTSVLVSSNIKKYKHHWIWQKERGTGFQVAKYRPMMKTEDIIVFSNKDNFKYYPQMVKLDKPQKYSWVKKQSRSNPLANYENKSVVREYKYPTNILEYKTERGFHPTQKPVPLLEYLIKTYTLEGETILDNCMGSGSTGVACVNTNRDFIGIEMDEIYFKIATERIKEATNKKGIDNDKKEY